MDLKNIGKNVRIEVLKMMRDSSSSHIGACYSVVEILVVLFFKILNIDPANPQKFDRDRFLLSKAHSSPALYAILAEKGFFPKHILQTYYQNNGILPGHIDKDSVPGIEYSLGSLGHGLSVGAGMAIANKRKKNNGKVFVLLGDGECDEGSIWEAVMFSSHHKLDNLTAIVDYNKIQSFGNTNEIINQEPIVERWKSFGWMVIEINGHDFVELIDAFSKPQDRPKVVIAHTIKGKGVSFMENSLDWHYKSPNKEQYERALRELMDRK